MARSRRERSLLLDTESLRVFRELIAQGGFTAAANVLGIPQPTVSLKIRRLEERIGLSLIRREGHSFTITAHGRDLLAHAEEIVEAHDRAVDHMQRSELSGSLRLGCDGEVAQSGLFEVTNRFRRIHPDVDLAIRVRNSRILHGMLDNGEIDVALMQIISLEGELRPTDDVWRHDDLHLVQGLAVDFDDAEPVPLIMYGTGSLYDPYLTGAMAAAGRTYRMAFDQVTIGGHQSAIEAGLGVGMLNTPNVTDQMRPWAAISPAALPQVVFVLRSRPGAEGDELIAALRAALSETLKPVLS